MKRSLLALLLLLAVAPLAWGQDARLGPALERFAAAQTLEQTSPSAKSEIQAGYRAAAEAFLEVHERDGVNSARLFTNIGNAYFFAGDLGDASLWYARALVLAPDDPSALAGRQLVRRQLPWQRPKSVGEDLVATLFFWHAGLSFDTRSVLFLMVWPLAFVLLALGKRRRIALALGLFALVAGGALLTSLVLSTRSDADATRCVLRVSVEGRSGDSKSYSLSHSAPLPAGSEAELLEDRGAWRHLALPDGTQAWVPSESVARVVPQ